MAVAARTMERRIVEDVGGGVGLFKGGEGEALPMDGCF